jgi:hypothetical protein
VQVKYRSAAQRNKVLSETRSQEQQVADTTETQNVKQADVARLVQAAINTGAVSVECAKQDDGNWTIRAKN